MLSSVGSLAGEMLVPCTISTWDSLRGKVDSVLMRGRLTVQRLQRGGKRGMPSREESATESSKRMGYNTRLRTFIADLEEKPAGANTVLDA